MGVNPMLERGHRIYSTHRIRLSKNIEAPLKYVYEWCTDYRSDDWMLSPRRPHPRFRTMKLSPRRLLRIRLTPTSEHDPEVAVDVIRLAPPDAWHTDQIDEQDRETVDYKLVALGATKTRLDLLVTERWVTPNHLSRAGTVRRLSGAWDRYIAQIETRYRSGRRAKG
jgi:hypothetical protein